MSSYDELLAYTKQLERRLAKLERQETNGSSDDYPIYLLASGARTGASSQAQVLANGVAGDTAANGDLTINGTSHATKTTSYVLIQPSGGKVGVGLSTPANALDVSGVVSASGDVLPLGVAYGVGDRLINVGRTPDTHFASVSIPSGYSWAGSPFEGTPIYLSYNSNSDYLQVTAASGGGRDFLYRSVTNTAGSWQGRSLLGRFATGATTEIGLRLDNGTDNSYAEIYTSGALANGMQRVDFRYRTGGGSVTTVNSAIIVPCSVFVTLQLYCYYSASNYYIGGYLVGENGGGININGFTTTATTYLPAAGRAGVVVNDSGNYGSCDWLINEFG